MSSFNVNGFFPGELKPDAVVAGCVEIYENAWPNPKETINMIEKECADPFSGVYWERASTIGQGTNQDARTNLLCNITDHASVSSNALAQNIHNQFNMLLLATTVPYQMRYNLNGPLEHEGYQILRYGSSQEYKPHYDGGTLQVPRQISCVCYLNDDYEGGEIEFVHYNVKIKPEPGMLILFPSSFSHTHHAHPIKDGVKYNLVTWLRN